MAMLTIGPSPGVKQMICSRAPTDNEPLLLIPESTHRAAPKAQTHQQERTHNSSTYPPLNLLLSLLLKASVPLPPHADPETFQKLESHVVNGLPAKGITILGGGTTITAPLHTTRLGLLSEWLPWLVRKNAIFVVIKKSTVTIRDNTQRSTDHTQGSSRSPVG
ncbi:hypothetical protein CSAL01_07267 [Colletotrichum salicis]|uniref:Uncharacterized protein n=1 Tax=Colletotrichum salicis TaxID=1209931 RepID=A0A135TII7_9PEZI|nr:hypothetical protein CSAL01_07267 [Colletotrichum salicis]